MHDGEMGGTTRSDILKNVVSDLDIGAARVMPKAAERPLPLPVMETELK